MQQLSTKGFSGFLCRHIQPHILLPETFFCDMLHIANMLCVILPFREVFL